MNNRCYRPERRHSKSGQSIEVNYMELHLFCWLISPITGGYYYEIDKLFLSISCSQRMDMLSEWYFSKNAPIRIIKSPNENCKGNQ